MKSLLGAVLALLLGVWMLDEITTARRVVLSV
jgi:hypothetical protein